ncbi:sugar phosphate isomerase/epimerase [Fulvivirgaceae bacterium PWU5]|uniref:Sugar phosphate isomerase/epimerase n=1 Tax=Dawidia cretensis TaxID=2782350 RepID=A0AAP2GPH5_9BACT|nr:sugar phosphate isomerase/epimerase [Dawidia cretensis]MBT1708641.1 sugar phosphate isomerase/epimerase [Dawidia cretensis]
MMQSRSTFLKMLGLSAAALGLSPTVTQAAEATETKKDAVALQLGLASYTLRKFSLDDVIKISKRLGLTAVSLKSMHMPLESSAEDLRAIAEKVKAAGLRLYGAGVIYMNTEQEVETVFNYAVAAQLEMIVGVPKHSLLSMVNEKVKAHNIKVAIHNHGPGDEMYSSPADVYNKIKDLDKRIGFCIDIGHVIRIGQDPVAFIEKYKDRLYDLHMKDVDKRAADGAPIEVGRGVIPIPDVVKALKKINYQGVVAFEYEKDGDDAVPGLAESIGYVRGIMKLS